MSERKLAKFSTFWPPHCPNEACAQSALPARGGFLRHGHYVTRGRLERIPRFICRSCRRTMSSQTFDSSYRLRMPELEHAILREIAQGASHRRVAHILGINRKTVSRRLLRVRGRQEPARQVAVADAVARAISEAGRRTIRSAE